MAGPRQASIFCVVMGCLPIFGPWFSSAALALVVLRVGVSASLKVLPWAVLPALVWLAVGDPGFLALLLSVYSAAIVLEQSRSLSLSLAAVVVVSAMSFLLALGFVPATFEQLDELLIRVIDESPGFERLFEQEAAREEADAQALKDRMKQSASLLARMSFAWMGALTACLVLLLARWWQSLLFKPGAFQLEFHAMRLNWNQVLVLVVLMGLSIQGLNQISLGGPALEGTLGLVLAPVFIIPMLLACIALVHGLVAIAGGNSNWLGAFYISLLLLWNFIYIPLIIIALLDVVFDFRARFKRHKSQS